MTKETKAVFSNVGTVLFPERKKFQNLQRRASMQFTFQDFLILLKKSKV